jgi:hypothetical protein
MDFFLLSNFIQDVPFPWESAAFSPIELPGASVVSVSHA